jgi:transketolase
MEFNQKNIKRWSIMGQRAVLGTALLDVAEGNDDLVVLTADVASSAGLERFKKKYPEKLIDVGIAEQNMMGIATGLASEGFNVVTTTFAPFQTMRCLEQIRVNLGYMQEKVVFVGLAGGIVHGFLGNTHCSIEDIGVLRSIPNIAIVSPADGAETVKCINAALDYDKSVYIRLTGAANQPVIYESDFDYQIGKANCVLEGEEVAILANGMLVHEAKMAGMELQKSGISCAVYDMHTVKPIDKDLLQALSDYKLILTVEEHNVIGGLGSAVAEYYASQRNRPIHVAKGIPDLFPHETDYHLALHKYELDATGIKSIVEKSVKEL